ncbi:MAG: malonyl-CoA decarboxylase [Hyphomicrobiales bacterium]|nr:malonyl-CoA decarboxylase [Hyphomicrobiales bacterium]
MTTILSDLLSTITERGLTLLEPDRQKRPAQSPDEVLESCEFLLTRRGEASGIAVAANILHCFGGLEDVDKRIVLEGLASRFGVDIDATASAVDAFRGGASQNNAVNLHFVAEPRRQELIRRLNRAPAGTASLAAMRADLLRFIDQGASDLDLVDRDFLHLFGSWFNRGFLVLQRIDWRTQANILEKIIAYEAVHEIDGWDDLRRRVEAADRRLYAFFHPALPEEPLVFVEIALTTAIPTAIGPVLTQDRPYVEPGEATTAAFYAISNCQPGLRGVSFGSFLVKQVVEELREELPHLRAFVTLSPLPGFRSWLDSGYGETPGMADREDLTGLAALYITEAKGTSGEPADPVARFHLRNGARLESINLGADMSAKGLRQSHGVMVNYLYDPAAIERNHESFAHGGDVVTGPMIKKLLRRAPRLRRPTRPHREANNV